LEIYNAIISLILTPQERIFNIPLLMSVHGFREENLAVAKTRNFFIFAELNFAVEQV